MISPLVVGPIIRQSDNYSIRVWGQGKAIPNTNCYLVARIYDTPNVEYTIVDQNTDYIATLRLLVTNESKQYQMGMIHMDSPLNPVQLTRANWSSIPVYNFKLDETSLQPLSFLLGSCRFLWPIRLWPSHKYYFLMGESGDRIFQSMNRLSVDFVAMTGDQIYADTTICVVDALMRAKSYTDFKLRYQTAFTYPHMRQLLANNTTYMIGDDHEYRDNYNTTIAEGEPDVFRNAMTAFNLYQYVDGPRTSLDGPYWFTNSRKGVPFFWMDTRNERTSTQIISSVQMSALKSWLVQHQNIVKCVVTSVPMFLHTPDEDNWQAYPDQLKEILDILVEHHIQGLIVLTGDSHMGVSGQYNIVGKDIIITELMSSGLAAPFHDDADNVALSHEIRDYTVRALNLSQVMSKDLFSRITISKESRTVQFSIYDINGELLSNPVYRV